MRTGAYFTRSVVLFGAVIAGFGLSPTKVTAADTP
jgi:hypothetical protein